MQFLILFLVDSLAMTNARNKFRDVESRGTLICGKHFLHVLNGVFLPLFKAMGFTTLGDIVKMVKDYSDAAYQIACFQLGITDLDILSSAVAPQNLCTAYILKNGGGRPGLKLMLDTLNGPSEYNDSMAAFLLEQTKDLPFMNQ